MKIIITQKVKVIGNEVYSCIKKEFESNIIPRVGDYISDPLWKETDGFQVTRVNINYQENECYINIKPDEEEYEKKFTYIIKEHGWETSW